MSNANRDYAIVYDVKNSLLVLSRPLNFYLTDKNTSNIFVKLVTRVIVGDGIDQYTDIENASSYVLTMRVIKPDDEVKSIIATQHESESIFQFDLTEDFKDVPGKYICELTISNIVNGRQEFTTSDPFNYEVKRSILSNVKNIIEGKDTTVEKLLNDLYATKAELSSQIKDKANKSDLDIERKRINSFAKLSEGSTTGDAELIDARIGQDGKTYDNVGTAIRTQFKQVYEQLLMEDIPFDNFTSYIDKNGDATDLGGWRATNFIKVRKGDIIQVTALGYRDNVSAIYLYDDLKYKVGPLQISNDEEQTYIVTVPQDGYIRCSGKLSDNLRGTIVKINPEIYKGYNEYVDNFSLNVPLKSWIYDTYINFKDGTKTDFTGYSSTDYIDIRGLDNVYVYVTEFYDTQAGIAFYDKNKKYIGGIGVEGSGENPNMGQLIEIKLKGHYMRLSCKTKYINSFKFYTTIRQMLESMKVLRKSFDLGFNYNWTSGSYIRYTDGEVVSFTNKYSYSDYIDISKYNDLCVYITEYYDYLAGIAFYDYDKKYIGGIGIEVNDENPNLGQLIEIKLKGHYMRLTCRTSYLNLFELYTTQEQITKKTLYKEKVNPCFYRDNLNLIKMFNKIACIGDSYTEGAIEYKTSDGTKSQEAETKYSYPTQLSKISNVQTVNLGHSGYTTTQWYSKYQDIDLSGYDCAIIFLGINDWYQNNQMLDTQAYANIIKKLRRENKNIPIFCVTITKNYLTSAYTLNDKIKEVAINNNCYILDLGEYSDWTERSKWLNGSHPNAYGYHHNAEMINSYINYIIENNKANFYNLSFVGTDKIDF